MGCSSSQSTLDAAAIGDRRYGEVEETLFIVLEKEECVPLGFRVRELWGRIFIVSVESGGQLEHWCQANDQVVKVGYVIRSVNGETRFRKIVEELWKSGLIAMEVEASGSSSLFDDVMEACNACPSKPSIDCFPHVPARDCGVEECAICLDDVDGETMVAQLQCKHGFHHNCLASWLAVGQECCPLCKHPVDRQALLAANKRDGPCRHRAAAAAAAAPSPATGAGAAAVAAELEPEEETVFL